MGEEHVGVVPDVVLEVGVDGLEVETAEDGGGDHVELCPCEADGIAKSGLVTGFRRDVGKGKGGIDVCRKIERGGAGEKEKHWEWKR